jgi:hypothetical protein
LTRDEQILEDIQGDEMLQKDRRGKSHDPEFTKWLYEKFFGEIEEGTNRQVKRKRRKKSK